MFANIMRRLPLYRRAQPQIRSQVRAVHKPLRPLAKNMLKILHEQKERGKHVLAELKQRGVIKQGSSLTPVIQELAEPRVSNTDPHEVTPKRTRKSRARSPKQEAPVTAAREAINSTQDTAREAINSAQPETQGEALHEAEQLPMPDEVPLTPDRSLNDPTLQSRVAEFLSARYTQYAAQFLSADWRNIPRSMVKSTAHADFLAFWSQPFPWDQHVTEINKEIFRNDQFRSFQREAVNVVLARLNLLCCLPTGGGKSLVYQLPGLVARGTTIVISPLLALIHDQTTQLAKKGISVRAISSQVLVNEISAIYRDMSKTDFDVKFLYVTPERIAQSSKFMEALHALHKNGNLRSFAVDEAHCISEWGHDFRPDYRRLTILRQLFPEVPVIAVTGTCTPAVRDDIVGQLGLGDRLAVMQTSFNRPNIWLEVRPKGEDVRYAVYQYIASNNLEQQCGIVYCLTCRDAEALASYLQKCGLSAEYYHGGLTSGRRQHVQQAWTVNDTHVICTTVAFGLGIDKSDVRYVVHTTMPLSLEAYYQQVGRAGRDNALAWAVLFYRARDRVRIDHVISANASKAVTPAPPTDSEHVIVPDAEIDPSYEDTVVDYNVKIAKAEKLDDMEKFCQNSTSCRRQMLLSYFGEQFSAHNCNDNCDVCAHVTTMGDESRARLYGRKRFTFASHKKARKIFAKNATKSGKEYELLDENDPQFKEKQKLIAAKGAEIADLEETERKKLEAEFKAKMRQKFEEKKQRYAARQRMTRVKKTTLPKRNETFELSEDAAEELDQPRALQRKPVRSVKLLSNDPVVVQLHEICAEIAASRGVSVARVLTETTMKTIAKNRPQNFAQLSEITGKQKAALLSSRVLRLFKDD